MILLVGGTITSYCNKIGKRCGQLRCACPLGGALFCLALGNSLLFSIIGSLLFSGNDVCELGIALIHPLLIGLLGCIICISSRLVRSIKVIYILRPRGLQTLCRLLPGLLKNSRSFLRSLLRLLCFCFLRCWHIVMLLSFLHLPQLYSQRLRLMPLNQVQIPSKTFRR